MTTQPTVQPKEKTIAIIGNPNVGKSSIFNQLTGLNQKIGNYPGCHCGQDFRVFK
jgi:ferrous iron transport protein B